VSEHPGPTHQAGPDRRELTLGEASALFINQLATLLGCEIALAKAELTAHARQFSIGGIALLTGALFGLTGWLALLAAAGLGIARALPGWLAALIIGAVLCLLAAAAAAWGARRLSGAGQPLPMTAESIRRDLKVIRDGARQ
jgi:Putative Actinobacterial Holin-X, holin superfamily III